MHCACAFPVFPFFGLSSKGRGELPGKKGKKRGKRNSLMFPIPNNSVLVYYQWWVEEREREREFSCFIACNGSVHSFFVPVVRQFICIRAL